MRKSIVQLVLVLATVASAGLAVASIKDEAPAADTAKPAEADQVDTAGSELVTVAVDATASPETTAPAAGPPSTPGSVDQGEYVSAE